MVANDRSGWVPWFRNPLGAALILIWVSTTYLLLNWLTDGKYSQALVILVVALFGVVVVSVALLRYLKPPDDERRPLLDADALRKELLEVREDLTQLRTALSTISSPFTEQDKTALKSQLSNAFIQDTAAQELRDAAERMAKDRIQANVALHADKNADVTLARIHAAIPQSLRRANINLLIGIVTTFIGIGVLAYGVFISPPGALAGENATYAYVRQFVPRLSLAFLIEVFAYFFLRLYKADLASVRYLQNEMTNVEVARTALVTTILSSDKNATAAIADHLARVDRNTSTALATAGPVSRKEITSALEIVRAAAGLKATKD